MLYSHLMAFISEMGGQACWHCKTAALGPGKGHKGSHGASQPRTSNKVLSLDFLKQKCLKSGGDTVFFQG